MQADLSDTASSPTEDALRAEGERVEKLLDEVRRVAGPETWPRVDELVQRLVGLYGAALGRLLAHALEADSHDTLRTRVCADELLSSLLLVHGMHPDPLDARVRRAMEVLQPRLGRHAIALDSLDGARLVLRVTKPCEGCGTSHAAVESFVRMALEEAAPELTEIRLDGLAADRPKSNLVALRVSREGERS